MCESILVPFVLFQGLPQHVEHAEVLTIWEDGREGEGATVDQHYGKGGGGHHTLSNMAMLVCCSAHWYSACLLSQGGSLPVLCLLFWF